MEAEPISHRAIPAPFGASLRLALGYIVVPFVPPTIMLVGATSARRLTLIDWVSIEVLYACFGLLAMLLLGTPLLLVFRRLRWRGFSAFGAGGGLCAAITSYLALRNGHAVGAVPLFTLCGCISGLVFRAILYGFRRTHMNEANTSDRHL